MPNNISNDIEKAVAILKRGGLVAFPTETVYGLGADAKNEKAIASIFAAKERPFNHPLIVHLANVHELQAWAKNIPQNVFTLTEHFWPGPLTIILEKASHVSPLLTAQQNSIGLRIPRHPVALNLLKKFGSGIAAPSANRFTRISPTTAHAVYEELHNKVDLILEGGECDVGVESTIIDFTVAEPMILRPGMISSQAIEAVLGKKINRVIKSETQVPGMHHLHYAPTTKTILFHQKDFAQLWAKKSAQPKRIAWVMHSHMSVMPEKNFDMIQMSSDVYQYAHDLYDTLRKLDQKSYAEILIEAVSENSEWDAVRDRLQKASFKE